MDARFKGQVDVPSLDGIKMTTCGGEGRCDRLPSHASLSPGARYVVDKQKQKQVAIDSLSVLLESNRVVVVADRDCC